MILVSRVLFGYLERRVSICNSFHLFRGNLGGKMVIYGGTFSLGKSQNYESAEHVVPKDGFQMS